MPMNDSVAPVVPAHRPLNSEGQEDSVDLASGSTRDKGCTGTVVESAALLDGTPDETLVLEDLIGGGPLIPLCDAGSTTVLRTAGQNLPEAAPDDDLSIEQCQMRLHRGIVYLDDLGAPQGTFIRVRRSVPVEAGDELRIGASHFRITTAAAVRSNRS